MSGLRHLERLHALEGSTQSAEQPALLLWGVADDENAGAPILAEDLARVCLGFGEDPSSLSEPDIVLAWEGRVIFVEAKYRSGNERKRNYQGFPKYLADESRFAVPTPDVPSGGLYELVRNWVIGNEVAQRRQSDFTLINLGDTSLSDTAAEFSAQVAQGPRRRFFHRRWTEVHEASLPLPAWLEDYGRKRDLW